MTKNTWKLAGLAILVIGLAAALISITQTQILEQQAASHSSNTKTDSQNVTPANDQKNTKNTQPKVVQPTARPIPQY